MRLASLGSGSKGNATLVDGGDGLVLVDCGFSKREVRRRMARLGHEADEIRAILVTHEHGDHMGGVEALARDLRVPVYMTAGTWRQGPDMTGIEVRGIHLHETFELAGMSVQPVAVPHDAREPTQFVFRRGTQTIGVLTDLGSLTPHVVESYRDCDLLLLECNHDRDMLMNGPYPWSLKQRVGSDWGHLSNEQAAALLPQLTPDRLQHLVIAHVSETNNSQQRARSAIGPVLNGSSKLSLADQELGFGWITVDNS